MSNVNFYKEILNNTVNIQENSQRPYVSKLCWKVDLLIVWGAIKHFNVFVYFNIWSAPEVNHMYLLCFNTFSLLNSE